MRAFIKDGELHVITQEEEPMIWAEPLREQEVIYDKGITNVMRAAFREEFFRSDEWLGYMKEMKK